MGYDENFLGVTIPIPHLYKKQLANTLFTDLEEKTYLLDHLNYSVALCASRRLAWFSCANMDAALKKEIPRKKLTSSWKKEKPIDKEAIVNDKWYIASKKWLERGHLTPADVMEWGTDESDAIMRANETFFFSNAAPQIKRLNGQEWRMLEAYIGQESSKSGHARLSVFTGCVLHDDDPEYIHQLDGAFILQIPRLFWKVVYYHNPKGDLYRVGFLMSQTQLLEESQLVVEMPHSKASELESADPFSDLGKQKTYQVNISMIEKLTGHKMPKAKDRMRDERPREITLQEVELPSGKRFDPKFRQGILKEERILHILVGLEL